MTPRRLSIIELRIMTPLDAALIVRALYGLKSSAARWRDHIAATLRDMGFKMCQADPDVWLRANTRPSDGFQYYEYV